MKHKCSAAAIPDSTRSEKSHPDDGNGY